MNSPLPSEETLLLDGGLATQLERMGYDLDHPLWSARLLLENPDAIVAAHLAYLRAGAQCIISASYQTSLEGFRKLGLNRDEAAAAILLSVRLAKDAIDIYCKESRSDRRALLAASIGPYGASLADGSEYKGNYGVSDEVLIDFHRPRMDLLAASEADLLACETIPSLQEARVLNSLLMEQEKPAWVSFSCRDGQHLNDGNDLAEAPDLFVNNSRVIALGINCTSPQHIIPLLKTLKERTKKAIIVYPNSGEIFDAKTRCWHGTTTPLDCAAAAKSWHAHGATIIGGCCRMGPEHIEAMSGALDTA